MKYLIKLLTVLVFLIHINTYASEDTCTPPINPRRIMLHNYAEDTIIYIQSINEAVFQIVPTKKDIGIHDKLAKAITIKTVAGQLLMAWLYHELKTTRSISVVKVENEERHIITQELEDSTVIEYQCN